MDEVLVYLARGSVSLLAFSMLFFGLSLLKDDHADSGKFGAFLINLTLLAWVATGVVWVVVG